MRLRPSRVLLTHLLVLVIGVATSVWAQTPQVPPTPFSTDVQPEWLREVLPQAESFADKQGTPPTWPGYRRNPQTRALEPVGHVFLTADVPPEEAGYSAPIAMLVGLDTELNLTGLKLLDYHETYRRTKGDFLARDDLLLQFRDKSIHDDFQIDRDIDGMAGSTVSVFAIARGVRNAARQVAAAHLGYDPRDPLQDARVARIQETLGQKDWDGLLADGTVRELNIPLADGRTLQLWFTYLGHPGLGAFWIGDTAYARAERGASAYLGGDEMVLVAVGGSGADQFRFDLLQVDQEREGTLSWFRRFTAENFIGVGDPDSGLMAGRAALVGVIVLPDRVDFSRPFTLAYRSLGSRQRHTLDFQPVGIGLRLAQGEDVLTEAEIAAILQAENRWLNRLLRDPPWGVTPWDKVAALLAILALAMVAFLRKSDRLRWLTLGLTTVYLGFIDSGFLSIAQVINTLHQGPGFLLSNLPLLLFVSFTVVTTLLWGRIFCSSLCPFGAVQDFITRVTPKRWQRRVPQSIHDRALYLKYGILALLIVAALMAGDVSIFQYFEPFGTLFFLQGSGILWLILIGILAACVVVPRFYCRYGCPLGASLGVVSLVSPLRIPRVAQCQTCIVCERACPTGAIRREQVDFKECVRCDLCERKLIQKAGACRHDLSRIIAASR